MWNVTNTVLFQHDHKRSIFVGNLSFGESAEAMTPSCVQCDANVSVCVCTQISMNLLFDDILRSVAQWRLCVWYETKTLDWGKDLVTSCLRYNPRAAKSDVSQ